MPVAVCIYLAQGVPAASSLGKQVGWLPAWVHKYTLLWPAFHAFPDSLCQSARNTRPIVHPSPWPGALVKQLSTQEPSQPASI